MKLLTDGVVWSSSSGSCVYTAMQVIGGETTRSHVCAQRRSQVDSVVPKISMHVHSIVTLIVKLWIGHRFLKIFLRL